MSETILLIGHGSRDREGVAEFLRFAADVQRTYTDRRVEPCFLEFAQPDILTAVERAVAGGAEGVVLMPLFLFAARHMKEDIAGALVRAQARFPALPIYAAQHLGVDARLLAILDERLVQAESEGAAEETRPEETVILLVGRGSRRAEGNAGVYEIAERLRVRQTRPVAVCFAGLAQPGVTEGIRQVVEAGARRIFILPYLLFAGVLSKRITAAAAAAQREFPRVDIRPAGHLGGHRYLLDAVRDRIAEARARKWEVEYV